MDVWVGTRSAWHSKQNFGFVGFSVIEILLFNKDKKKQQ